MDTRLLRTSRRTLVCSALVISFLCLAASAPVQVAVQPGPVVTDSRLIQDVERLPGKETLERVLRLKGVTFRYTDEGVALSKGSLGFKFGFVAQDAAEVFPGWVEPDKDGFKTVSEQGVAALLLEAIRGLRAETRDEITTLRTKVTESDTIIEDLRKRVLELEADVKALEHQVFGPPRHP